jgi:hypothetical protein
MKEKQVCDEYHRNRFLKAYPHAQAVIEASVEPMYQV